MLRWRENFKKWEKAKPIYPKNKIVSSSFSSRGNSCHFHPSYNCEDKPDIKKLLTMEYEKIWTYEHFAWSMKQKHVRQTYTDKWKGRKEPKSK